MGNQYEFGNLVDHINWHACVYYSYVNIGFNLRFLMPGYYFRLINTFNNAGILYMLTFDKSSGNK